MLDLNKALTQDAVAKILRRQSVDADDIRERINTSAADFVRWLFSGRAHIARGKARIGDVTGSPGGSLAIELSGPNVGSWFDHATGEGGGLVDLYMAYMGYGNDRFVLALKEIASEFLGDPVEVSRTPWDKSAAKRIDEKAQKLGTKPREDMAELGPKVADWKYRDINGNFTASVARYETEAGKTYRPFKYVVEGDRAQWVMGAPDIRPLYRIPEISRADTVVLVEGEKCADALASIGVEATTAMQGSKAPIEKTDWSVLAQKRVVIWPDNDQTGLEYAEKAAAHLRTLGCVVSIVTIPPGKPEAWDAADCIAEGMDAHEVLRTATQPEAKAAERFPIMDWRDLKALKPARYLVKGFVPEGGFVGVYGPSGHKKSFAVVDLLASVATGRPWHDCDVIKGVVLYIVGEGQRGVAKRLMAWEQERCALTGFYVLPAAPTLPDDLAPLFASIDAMPTKPTTIAIDTLARSFKGNENAAEDMSDWIRAAAAIQSRYACTLIFVHHTGKDLDKKDRGHSSLRAAADTMISVRKSGERGVTVAVDKQKDDDELTIELRAVSVRVGTDPETNEPITSLVLVKEDDATPRAGQTEPNTQTALTANQQLVLDLIQTAGPIGFTRLALGTHLNRGTLKRALNELTQRGLVHATGDKGEQRWVVGSLTDDEV